MPWSWQDQGPTSVAIGGQVGSVASQKETKSWPRQEADYLRARLRDTVDPETGNPTKYNVDDFTADGDQVGANVYLDKVTEHYKDEANEALKMEFIDWLQGIHPANEGNWVYENGDGKVTRRWVYQDNASENAGAEPYEPREGWTSTPWGQKQLTHLPGVREWLRDMKEKDAKNELDLNLLAEHGPSDLESAWVYFKTWVKGRPKSDAINLLPPAAGAWGGVQRSAVMSKQPNPARNSDYPDVKPSAWELGRDPKGPNEVRDAIADAADEIKHQRLQAQRRKEAERQAFEDLGATRSQVNANAQALRELISTSQGTTGAVATLSDAAAELNAAVNGMQNVVQTALQRQAEPPLTDVGRAVQNAEIDPESPLWLQQAQRAVFVGAEQLGQDDPGELLTPVAEETPSTVLGRSSVSDLSTPRSGDTEPTPLLGRSSVSDLSTPRSGDTVLRAALQAPRGSPRVLPYQTPNPARSPGWQAAREARAVGLQLEPERGARRLSLPRVFNWAGRGSNLYRTMQ